MKLIALRYLLLLLLPFLSAHAQVDVSQEIEVIHTNWNMPGLMGMAVKQGRVIAHGAAGYRRIGHPERLHINDPINIASCTKWMTATLAARLVDKGLIHWTNRVRDLFPEFATFNPVYLDATLDQLLCHQAGIEDSTQFEQRNNQNFGSLKGSLSEMRRWASQAVLRDPQEPKGVYANQGYAVAASMMEISAGKSWEKLMQEEIFTPLRMSTATFGIVYNDDLPPQRPVGHFVSSRQSAPTPLPGQTPQNDALIQAFYGPGGSVICTMQDWAKFLHAQVTADTNRFLSATNAALMHKAYAGTEGYGRGVYGGMSRPWATPGHALSHTGSIFGHRTVFWVAPARDFIVVVFTNGHSEDHATDTALDNVASLLVSRFASAAAAGAWLEAPRLAPLTIAQPLLRAEFSFSTLPGVSYQVESSPDLRDWMILQARRRALSHEETFSDSEMVGRRFYRVRPVP